MKFFKRVYAEDKFKFAFLLMAMLMLILVIAALFVVPLIFGSIAKGLERLKYSLMGDMGQYFYFALSKNPYTSDFSTIYLPLAILMMKPFAIIGKDNPVFYMLDDINKHRSDNYTDQLSGVNSELRYIDQFNSEIITTSEFWIATALYYVITFIFIAIVLYKIRKWNSNSQYFYALGCFFLSGFTLVGFVRGTNVFTCLLLILVFWHFKDSKKAWLREVALICLAIAGTLRIYPLLFGAILLKDKKWLSSLRVAVYTIILAVVPFFFYEESLTLMKAYFSNLSSFVGGGSRMQGSMNLCVYSFFGYLFSLAGLGGSLGVKIIGILSLAVMLGICLTVAFLTDKKYVRLTAIVFGLLLATPVSYYYVTMFITLPIIIFFDEGEEDKIRKWIYVAMFAFLAFFPTSITGWYLPHIIAMCAIEIYELVRLIKSRKNKKDKVDFDEQNSVEVIA